MTIEREHSDVPDFAQAESPEQAEETIRHYLLFSYPQHIDARMRMLRALYAHFFEAEMRRVLTRHAVDESTRAAIIAVFHAHEQETRS